jgi:alkylation response protein AidB-like acyl-CoA dehydrogenase
MLLPSVEEYSCEEYNRTELSSSRLEQAFTRGWFKIFTPRYLGGREETLMDGVSQLVEAARHFGSLGWCANLGSGAAFFAPSFDRKTATEIFGADKSVVAGSGQTSQARGEKLSDGRYLVQGTWGWCTGAAHATHFTVSVDIPNEGVRSFAVPAALVKVCEHDQLFGLQGTSSHTISIEPVELDARFAFDIGTIVTDFHYPLHRIPFMLFAQFCMAASFIGISRCFSQVSLQVLGEERSAPFASRCEEIACDGLNCLHQAADKVWRIALEGGVFPDPLQCEVTELIVRIRDAIMQTCLTLFQKGGMRMIDKRSVAHWAFRDVLTAGQHFILDGR